MNLHLSLEEEQFRDELCSWLKANFPAGWEEMRNRPLEARFEFLRKWQRTLSDGGWAGASWPKKYGGRGSTLMQQAIFWQEMARSEAPPMVNVLGLGLIGPTIMAYGTESQKTRFLPAILNANEIWCQGFSEPNAGSDLANVQSEAKLDGDHYVVNGHKIWMSYGWAADWCELVVRTGPAAQRHKNLTVLLLDLKTAGVSVRPLRQMTGEAEFSELFLDNVRIPIANRLGKEDQGWQVAMATLMHERGTFGASLQIAYKRNIARLIEVSRSMPSKENPKSKNPLMRQKLAQCYAEIEIMGWNQMRVFSRISAAGVPGPEGSIQKIFWSELNQHLQQVAQELLGPYGQLSGPDAIDKGMWSYGYLRSRGNTIEAGTSEIQRNIIGHFVLGLPKSY